MRPLELSLVGLVLLLISAALGHWRPLARPGVRRLFALLVTVTATGQIALEGYRWQMAPAYVLTAALLLWLFLPTLLHPSPSATGRRLLVGLSLLAWLVAAALPILLPVPRVPAPAGPYAIGTLTYDWVDESRLELYSENPRDRRELVVQVWYPAEPTLAAEPAPYIANVKVGGPAIARTLDLPPFLLGHLDLARTHAAEGAAVAAGGPFPLLLFAHGLGGMRMQNTYLVEHLVSHGYVVAAADHTYASAFTVFPDGRVALFNPDVLGTVPEEFDQAAAQLVDTWASDVRFVLDRLTALNAADPDGRLTGTLNLDKVGVFGHSTGGGTAVLVCGLDVRCQAALGMDAWLEPLPGEGIAAGLTQPFLLMKSEEWATREDEGNNERTAELYEQSPNDRYLLTIEGTQHYDFSDLPLLSPVTPWMGLTGPIGGRRGLSIVNDYALAFFNQHLKGMEEVLLAGPAAGYPEVQLSARHP